MPAFPANSYATLADMQERFAERDLIQLTDEAGNGTIDEDRVNQALADGATRIDSYVAARHKNISELVGHAMLRRINCDLAFRDLWTDAPPDQVEKRYEAAVKDLERIASGMIRLDQGEEEQASRPGAIHTGGGGKHFSRDSLESF